VSEPPDASPVADARGSAVRLRFDKGGCSGVVVAPDLVLSAAHCARGYDGKGPTKTFYVEEAGRRHDLELVEMGDFDPPEDRVSDWMLLRAAALPPNVTVARFAERSELEAIARDVSTSIADRQVPVVAFTYPYRATRSSPRESLAGERLFESHGYVKSARAFKEETLLTLERGSAYDDATDGPVPRFAGDVEGSWRDLQHPVRELAKRYERDGAPITYHSADYAPGSSGGGIFLARTGHLLGIIPMGTNVGDRTKTYVGFGQAYRIDAICARSKTLGPLAACQALADR
jgi:hypothetical protein